MNTNFAAKGHCAALITILIWGMTFISTKILLEAFQPVEILFFRFVIGFAAFWLVFPKKRKKMSKKQEATFAAAGFCGICLYYLLENIALTDTLASNVGVIVSVSPFFTALLTHFFMKEEEKLGGCFFVGFAVAIIGIGVMTFQGQTMQIHPKGDILALAAAAVWACYAVLTRKISGYGYSSIQTTRHTFLYGILFMIPTLFVFSFQMDLQRFSNINDTAPMLFLGLGASALCFVTWGIAVKSLGAVKTSIYIYIVPVITILTSAMVLKEPVTPMTILGTAMTLSGLFLSEKKIPFLIKKQKN